MSSGLIVIGGSYAAAQIATAARKYGYDAPIRVLSDEDTLPYQRPPLSKAFLTGGEGENTLPLRAQALYESQRIDVELGVRVAAIDRSDKFVSSREGRRYSYDRLALAVGARARLLEVAGSDLDGVFTLRTLADARKIKRWLVGAETVAVIGAGFIGLEVASAAVQLGKRVLVLEAVERALARSCPQVMSDWIARLHAAHGVKMLFSAQVASLKGEGGHVRAVVLRDGSEQPADLVIIGIGAVPNIELAKNCGLACNGGIAVDRFARTSDPEIVAAGDCSRFPSPFADAPVRLESVQNATDQSRSAAASVVGREAPYEAVPWFWSDQYDVKLQMTGLSQGHDSHVVRGSMDEQKFSVFYFRNGVMIAADSVNRPADHMAARKLVASRAACRPSQVADGSFDLKTLLSR